MRNKHEFKGEILVRCPFDACGKTFTKYFTVEFVTNQRGDVIDHKIRG